MGPPPRTAASPGSRGGPQGSSRPARARQGGLCKMGWLDPPSDRRTPPWAATRHKKEKALWEPPPGTSKKGRTFNDTSEFPRYFRSKRYDTSDWAIPSLEGSFIGFLKVLYLRIGFVPLKTCSAGMLPAFILYPQYC